MTIRIALIIISSFVFGCSSENKSNERSYISEDANGIVEDTSDATDSNIGVEPTEKDKSFNITPLRLSKKTASGTKFRLASANALDKIYARVFARQKLGNYVYDCPAYYIFECKDSFFTNGEALALGGTYLTRYVANFKQPDNLTLNYLRSLRSALRRECATMIYHEWDSLSAGGDPTANQLVTVLGVPPKEVFDNFMRKLLGINGLSIKLDSGAPEYRKAFEQSLATFPDEIEIGRAQYINTYINTCIAISMDPRVILY